MVSELEKKNIDFKLQWIGSVRLLEANLLKEAML